jgi:GABA(A) receptor-associated protein
MVYKFQQKYTYTERLYESSQIKKKYVNRIPIIIEKDIIAYNIPSIDKSKYLAPTNMTLGEFMIILRKKLNVRPEETIFFIIENTIQPTSHTIETIYNKFADDDGFLYIIYTSENTFG